MTFSIGDQTEQEIRNILTLVYDALKEKGYNPINQIVGYILSEDPTYITTHNSARNLIRKIDRDTLYLALDHLMADEYTIEHRMMLCGSIYRDGKLIAEDAALNDITITREGNLRVVRFDNYVNGEFLNSYSADGIIIATPTGSTGYSLSAGGPIISPSASLMLMTPLAPHTLNTRSIVFPAEDVIEVELGPSRDGGIEQGMAYFDGDTRVPMKTGDRIVIKKARRDTLIVKISNISFLETLRKKMANI